MKHIRAVGVLASMILACGPAQGSSVIGAWDYAGASSVAGYELYDFRVRNNTSTAIGTIEVSFEIAGGTFLDGGLDLSPTPLAGETYFQFGEPEVLAPGGFISKSSTVLLGILDLQNPGASFAPGQLRTVARVALSSNLDIEDVGIGGVIAGLPGGIANTSPEGLLTQNDIYMAIRGDTDLDGDVDNADIARTFGNYTGSTGSGARWALGDSDQDGDVDNADIAYTFRNYTGASGTYIPSLALAPPAPHMPEPLTLATFGLAGLGLAGRARKRLRVA